MTVLGYAYNLVRSLDQFVNALLAGNSRQTISSRAYEAAILTHRWWWRPVYWGINGLMYGLRWLLARPLGYRWGEDMPVNHCADAWQSDPDEATYAGLMTQEIV